MSSAEKLLDVVAGYMEIPREKLSLATTLEEVGLDSLEFINLLLVIGDAFHPIPDNAISRLGTIGDILAELEVPVDA